MQKIDIAIEIFLSDIYILEIFFDDEQTNRSQIVSRF
jgi:hypothetical protein